MHPKELYFPKTYIKMVANKCCVVFFSWDKLQNKCSVGKFGNSKVAIITKSKNTCRIWHIRRISCWYTAQRWHSSWFWLLNQWILKGLDQQVKLQVTHQNVIISNIIARFPAMLSYILNFQTDNLATLIHSRTRWFLNLKPIIQQERTCNYNIFSNLNER